MNEEFISLMKKRGLTINIPPYNEWMMYGGDRRIERKDILLHSIFIDREGNDARVTCMDFDNMEKCFAGDPISRVGTMFRVVSVKEKSDGFRVRKCFFTNDGTRRVEGYSMYQELIHYFFPERWEWTPLERESLVREFVIPYMMDYKQRFQILSKWSIDHKIKISRAVKVQLWIETEEVAFCSRPGEICFAEFPLYQ